MKKRHFFISVLTLTAACLLSFPGSAWGQARTWAGTSLDQMVASARWRLGSLRVNASLNLANVGYDTDIYFGYLDEPFPDLTLTASIPVQALLPLGKKTVLELNYNPQYMFYGKAQRERAWNNVVGGWVHFNLEKLYVRAGGGLANIRRRLSPELDVNVREKSDSLNGTLLWQTSRNVSLGALYAYARYDYGETEFAGIRLAESLNREESFVDFVTYLQPNTKIRLFVDAQYGMYTFTEAAAGARNTQSYGIFGGLAFIPREGEAGPIEPAQGSISLGYKRFDVLSETFVDGSSLVGAVDVSVGLFKRTTINAFFSRDFAFSVYSDGAFYLTTAVGGGIRRRLSRKVAVSYDLSFGQGTYPKDVTVGPSLTQSFRYINHVFGLNVRVARHLGVIFQSMLSRRALGEIGADKIRNFFGLSLVYGVPIGSIQAPMRGLSQ